MLRTKIAKLNTFYNLGRKTFSKIMSETNEATFATITSDQNPGHLCQFILVRHGERADLAPPHRQFDYEINSDPPLTSHGILQAQETGEFLKEYIDKNEFDEIVVESSPFIRTMQTASQIAKAIGIPKIKINYHFTDTTLIILSLS